MSEQIPTPETDAATRDDWCEGADATDPKVSRKIERERDELINAFNSIGAAIGPHTLDATSLVMTPAERAVAAIESLHRQLAEAKQAAQIACDGWERTKKELTKMEGHYARVDGDNAQMAELLWHIVADGKGREFFPTNLDGSKNEWFEKAAKFAGVVLDVPECQKCHGVPAGMRLPPGAEACSCESNNCPQCGPLPDGAGLYVCEVCEKECCTACSCTTALHQVICEECALREFRK